MTDHIKLKAALKSYLDELLTDDRQRYLSSLPGRPVYLGGSILEGNSTPYEEDTLALDAEAHYLGQVLEHRDVEEVREEATKLMTEFGLEEGQRRLLSVAMVQAQLKAIDLAREQLKEGPKDTLNLIDELLSPSSEGQFTVSNATPEKPKGPLFSEVLPGFIEAMTAIEGWKKQTIMQNSATYAMFTKVCGDKPVQEYGKADTTKFYDLLRKLPSLWAKDKDWKGMSLEEIATATEGQELKRLAMRTVQRHIFALGKLFDEMKRRGVYVGDNPAHGFRFPSKKKANRLRSQWEGDKLTALFNSPGWQGCATNRRRAKPGDLIFQDSKYWLPLLGLYHGNRLEEFAQLRREDLKQQDGNWYFHIHGGDGRQIKNDQSERRVPLHPIIESMGFLDYVDTVTDKAQDMVFPDLVPGGADKKYGHAFSKWFTRYRKDIGVYESGLDYHSFRHGVTTRLLAAGVAHHLVDELTGHESQGTTLQVYKKEMPLELLRDAISKVSWPEVEKLFECPKKSRSTGVET